MTRRCRTRWRRGHSPRARAGGRESASARRRSLLRRLVQARISVPGERGHGLAREWPNSPLSATSIPSTATPVTTPIAGRMVRRGSRRHPRPCSDDDRGHDGEDDRAADLERGVHQAGGQALLVVGDAVGRLRCSATGRPARTRCRAAASSAGSPRRRPGTASIAQEQRVADDEARRAAGDQPRVPKRSTTGPIRGRAERHQQARPAGTPAPSPAPTSRAATACRA